MKRTSYPEKARARIKAGMITKRLHDFIEAKPSDGNYLDKIMTSPQVTAARVLLAKVLPDQCQVEHTGSVATENPKALNEVKLDGEIERLLAKASAGEKAKVKG